jgi:hypothetical protein
MDLSDRSDLSDATVIMVDLLLLRGKKTKECVNEVDIQPMD